MPKRREKDIQAAILSLLHARGVVAWKAGAGAFRVDGRYVRMGHKGVADIIGVLPEARCRKCTHQYICSGCLPSQWGVGRFLAIEVKVPGKDATIEQSMFLTSVRAAGGLAFVAHSCEEVTKEMGWTR